MVMERAKYCNARTQRVVLGLGGESAQRKVQNVSARGARQYGIDAVASRATPFLHDTLKLAATMLTPSEEKRITSRLHVARREGSRGNAALALPRQRHFCG